MSDLFIHRASLFCCLEYYWIARYVCFITQLRRLFSVGNSWHNCKFLLFFLFYYLWLFKLQTPYFPPNIMPIFYFCYHLPVYPYHHWVVYIISVFAIKNIWSWDGKMIEYGMIDQNFTFHVLIFTSQIC